MTFWTTTRSPPFQQSALTPTLARWVNVEIEEVELDRFAVLKTGFPFWVGGSLFQDACLRRLLEGLLIYSVLLQHVEEEYPLSRIPSEVRYYSSILIKEVENKVGLRSAALGV